MITYQQQTDKYFLRSKEILQKENINPIVRYQVFTRFKEKWSNFVKLKGMQEAIDFIRSVVGNKVKIYSLKDGDEVASGEPIMKLEGYVQDLIDLETIYLGIIAGRITGELNFEEIKKNTENIIKAAENKQVYYFGARHFHPEDDDRISKICFEAGFDGASTDLGAKYWKSKGIGTIPHALILACGIYLEQTNAYDCPTAFAAELFDKNASKEVPRFILIDTFNREVIDTVTIGQQLKIHGVRIDTCGENLAQYSYRVALPQILLNLVSRQVSHGFGVTIGAVWALKTGMRTLKLEDLKITVSSGFNAKKIEEFIIADKIYHQIYKKPLFDYIGTGSIHNSVMTTSDIVAYYSENRWTSYSKVGRKEILSERLKQI